MLGNEVKAITPVCFKGTNISCITFPEGLLTIGFTAFANCNNLKAITIPRSVNSLGGQCFPPHTVITFEDGSPFFQDDQELIYNSRTTLVLYLSERDSYTIPSFVETIHNNVFSGNNQLITIHFEEESKLKEIKESAFNNCINLTNIDIPNSVIRIETWAFFECISLKKIKIGHQLKEIYFKAFSGCLHLESIKFSCWENVTIREFAFANCNNLKNIIFSNNITAIQSSCFLNCLSLREIVFPSSLENIDTYAFSNTGITNITFPIDSKLTSIGMGCFSKCYNLSHITLPPNVKEIGSNCFENTNITTFIVPNRTEYMSDYVFKGCKNLVKFTIPQDCSLRNIGNLFFDGCSSLSVIECPRSEYFSVDVGALYNKSETVLFCFPPASYIKFFNLPQTLRTISSGAFIGCRNLISISIPDDSVRTIKQYAFANCSSLTSINIPKCVENVESSIFFGCDHLRCGVIIENRSISFIRKIISECLLNPKAIYSCDFLTCQCRIINTEITKSLLYAFTIILYIGML
ncbi:surface antigen Bsp, putative [Trichomonas vaginalis G3]|uniref:Surface antigen Bsp, putative n=1 Tax=Trichomonas vaginalis (strain ATCC PRA-98 / G3) TaxID=412133 RepID=A2FDQ4_TRIV3|nr:ribonuclease inhibitor domain-containing protein [Trichomonas vaginalis G3]EAX96954.1 surface antigen Bsp, putative [Trichomonas vaginalis G3]KAI5521353.1 ribonuclease inhibitor domain-containing protein [Trichomonas vaginalis G3]|eukprot:XP_001309884.1 surface antigen Bsp [Trichomonas vaginalis G3]